MGKITKTDKENLIPILIRLTKYHRDKLQRYADKKEQSLAAAVRFLIENTKV